MRDACEDGGAGARRGAGRGAGSGNWPWAAARDCGPKRTAVPTAAPPHVARFAREGFRHPGKADRYGTVFAHFSWAQKREGRRKTPGSRKSKRLRAGHKPCHNGHPCHSGAITVALAILRPRPSPLPSGRNSHPPCRCDERERPHQKAAGTVRERLFPPSRPLPYLTENCCREKHLPVIRPMPCTEASRRSKAIGRQKGWRRIRSDASLWCGRARRMPPRTNQ